MDIDPRDGDVRDEAHFSDRGGEAQDWSLESREPFSRDLDLPRGPDLELARDRDREYTLRDSETRILATVGAFRVEREGGWRARQATFAKASTTLPL